jgi:hypothetical protein
MDPSLASEGIRYREPLLPDIGHPQPGGALPDGTLHAYLTGADRTLCGVPLGLLHQWPARRWPAGFDERCELCDYYTLAD